MSLNSTPKGERIHIGFFGRMNAGKSSLMNCFTNQELSVVSDTLGTTTDPVIKTMELLPLGPVVLYDAPGFDDQGELGNLRVKKCEEVTNKVHVMILVIDPTISDSDELNEKFLESVKEKDVSKIVVLSKLDEIEDSMKVDELVKLYTSEKYGFPVVKVSCKTREGIDELRRVVAEAGLKVSDSKTRSLIPDYIKTKDTVILVTPIDSSAPKGRMILPQQQVLRALLDMHCKTVVVQPEELEETMDDLGSRVKLVITDSQAFSEVHAVVKDRVPLTSFSILMSKYKGDYNWQLHGANALDELTDGDKVLIIEGCTHHRQCEDIGTVKIPNLIRKKYGEGINFEFLSGNEFKWDMKYKEYKLAILCGGCMLSDIEMKNRILECRLSEVPVTNYGMVLAKLKGILDVVTKY